MRLLLWVKLPYRNFGLLGQRILRSRTIGLHRFIDKGIMKLCMRLLQNYIYVVESHNLRFYTNSHLSQKISNQSLTPLVMLNMLSISDGSSKRETYFRHADNSGIPWDPFHGFICILSTPFFYGRLHPCEQTA